MQFTPFRTTAAAVRTGMVIRSPWMKPHLSIEVEIVHHERFTNPQGETSHVVRWTGWEWFNGSPITDEDGNRLRRMVNGGGERAHQSDVRVEADLRPGYHQVSPTFGALTGRADAARLQVELESFLAELPGA